MRDICTFRSDDIQKNTLQSDEQPILIEHLSKYSSLLPSLALIFHLIESVDGKHTNQVSSEAFYMALGWCGYLEKHARRIYGMANNLVYQSAAKLAKKIQEGEVPTSFSVRDIDRKEWAMLDEKSIVQKACDELVDAGWIKPKLQNYEYGRPKSPIYAINPKLKIHHPTTENFF